MSKVIKGHCADCGGEVELDEQGNCPNCGTFIEDEDRVDENNPVKEMLRNSYFYESTSVNRTRTVKWCDLCNSTIPKGTGHNGAKIFNDEFYQVNFCSECDTKYKTELQKMENGDYDDF